MGHLGSNAARRLVLVLLGNALLRIAMGASGILVGLYLAELSNQGIEAGAVLAGTLGAVAFGAELLGAVPLGMLSDAVAPRGLVTAGALLGGAATQIFGMTTATGVFFLSRTVEGVGAAASAPSLLAHLTDVTDGNRAFRARVMSYFELSLLAGLALGGILAGQLWSRAGLRSFAAVAVAYLVSALLLNAGAAGSHAYGVDQALSGFRRALRQPSLRRLAPIWLCVNSIVGLWLGPTLSFLLTDRSGTGQYLAGVFADQPGRVGWALLGWAVVFGIGIITWSVVLPKMAMGRAMRIAIGGMLGACAGLFLLNHAGGSSEAVRWLLVALTSVFVMIESGFTPAALSLLAGAVGAAAGRGGAMGIYSVLLSLGAILGSLMAGWMASIFAVDGIIYATAAMGAIAMSLVGTVEEAPEPATRPVPAQDDLPVEK